MIKTQTLAIQSKGNADIINITDKINNIIENSKIKNGIAVVFIKHTTCSLAISEFESGLLKDLKNSLNELIPHDKHHHHSTNDDNADAHIKSTIIGQSLTIPIQDSSLTLGTWQNVVLIDFDPPRKRDVIVQIYGE